MTTLRWLRLGWILAFAWCLLRCGTLSFVNGHERPLNASSRPFRVVLSTCLWQRAELSEFVLSHYRNMSLELAARQDPIQLDMVVAGSEEEARRVAQNYGAFYVDVQNEPLGRKHNAALALAREQAPDLDALVVVGSDDVVNANYFVMLRDAFTGASFALQSPLPLMEPVPQTIQPRHHVLGLLDIYFLELKSGRLVYSAGYKTFENPIFGSMGLGRAYSGALLRLLDWTLWDDDLNSRLDRSAATNLITRAPLPAENALVYLGKHHDVVAVDIKTAAFASSGLGNNIWSFDILLEASSKSGRLHAFEDIDDVPSFFQTHFSGTFWTALLLLRNELIEKERRAKAPHDEL
ncbi:hypothetical protein FVE85_0824 [Porphyridium purpureum]|uniref:Glycosyltransferase 2-like domain-containing protein n=1 Tax=Porphyridium purpureum TaxID=35688 RepID=A0A5J4Z122_PORPP|nr:hypothetical protein FVE85_0824 [Porphyridium purpureum]|eukprot:POR3790..scf208_2